MPRSMYMWPHVQYQSDGNNQTYYNMYFLGKWQSLMFAKLTSLKIPHLRFHLVVYVGKLYPRSQEFSSCVISQLFFVDCSESLHQNLI